MELINQLIFAGALLTLLSILAGMVSSRLGAPLLLIFLLLGMLAGEDGPGGIAFSNYHAAFTVGSIALAVILFEGGLRTPKEVVRLVVWPAFSLATVGVLLSALAVGGMAVLIMGMSPLEGMLMGAVLASTDAAAVFMVLRGRGVAVNARVTGALELESGMNDPMAVFLTLICVDLLSHAGTAGGSGGGWHVLAEFLTEMIGGGIAGIAGGFALRWMVERLTLTTGLYPILVTAGALVIFAGANSLHASGFLAVYVAGVMLARAPYRAQQVIARFLDGLAWLAQIAMFLLLGLLVTPSALIADLPAAILLSVGLMVIARPGAVMFALLPFRFNWRERGFIAWVGLRGAVPIFLASIPILAGLPEAQRYFNVAFVAVLISLLVQGWTVGRAARFFGLEVPADPERETELEISLGHDAERELAGFRVQSHARALHHAYGALHLPKGCQILSVIRAESPLERFKEMVPEPGDYVIAMSPPEEIVEAHRLFARHDAAEAPAPEGFGEFVFSAETPAEEVALVYGLPLGPQAQGRSLGEYLHERMGKMLVVGDRLNLGEVELVLREVKEGRAVTIGLELETVRQHLPATRAWRKVRHPRRFAKAWLRRFRNR